MRIGVTGGRTFGKADLVQRTFSVLERFQGSLVLVHGAAPGADMLCDRAARESERWQIESYLADWFGPCQDDCRHGPRGRMSGGDYCPAAGPIRNQRMVDSGLGLLVAFSGGRGTADMISRARAAGVLVLRVEE